MVGFPLLLIPLAVYNILVFLIPVSLTDPVLPLTLPSGVEWKIAIGDFLLAFAALMLLFEVIKGARPGAKYLTDHLLSLIVFGAAAAEFLLLPKFGTSLYFLLTLFALVDFLAGVSLRRRRGAVVAEAAPAVTRKRGRAVEAPAAEPQFEQPAPAAPPAAAPAPPAPSAASIAESVLLDHPEPLLAQQPTAAPAVPSPGIQPNGAHPHPDTPPR